MSSPVPAVIVLGLFVAVFSGYTAHTLIGDVRTVGLRYLRGSTATMLVILGVLMAAPWVHGTAAAWAFRLLIVVSAVAGGLFPQAPSDDRRDDPYR